jgi:hypothetical protein
VTAGPAVDVAQKSSGFTLILAATAIVGVAGYVITWLVPASIGVGPYAVFAVFWSFTFLVAAALTGIQQEITRATHLRGPEDSGYRNRAGVFAACAFLVVLVLVLGTAPLWAATVFPTEGWALVLPLAVGAASYVPLAVLAGSLYGVGQWKALFALMSVEGVLRLVLVGIALAFLPGSIPLAWAVAIPFPVAVLAVWPFARASVVGKTRLDVALPRLTWNVGRTIVAAASMGLMVSGFPLVLSLTSATVPEDDLGLIILAATLTRAPLIVVGMALQSFLIVFFRTRLARFWRSLLQLEAVVLGLGAVLAALGYLLGPWVFALLFPGQAVPEAWVIATLVASSALVGALCVSAPAVLSRNAHSAFTAGWVLAALTTVICLLLPLEFLERTMLALLVGPAAGVLLHAVYLAVARNGEVTAVATDALMDDR